MASTNPAKQLIAPDGKRLSGRNRTDLREIKMSVGLLKKARGSAMVEWGRNKVIAGVFGPREVFPKFLTNPYRAIIHAKYSMAPFCSLEEHGRAGPNRRSQEISKVIKHVFENNVLVEEFPKTKIDITMEVVQSDGGTRVSALAAASLALIDAGIPVKDIVTPISVGKIAGQMVVDLDKDEDNFGQSDMPVAFSHRNGDILLWQMDGMLTKEQLQEGLEMAFEASKTVREIQASAIKAALEKGGVPNGSE